MNELAIHPNVYATGNNKSLIYVLERIWLREHSPGDGTLYIISGFANYNGGIRFFPIFRRHVDSGGKLVAIFGGSTSQNLTSKQVVAEMLQCGASVHIVNRKRHMHVKSYGTQTEAGETVVVTSGNFTGSGMSQNVEMSVLLDQDSTRDLGFSWETAMCDMLSQNWNYHEPPIDDLGDPAWKLLYDEESENIVLDETNEVTMILLLGHADTARINAMPGTNASKGTQYFWLSKDCYDFFPALTIPNTRGVKRTFSCMVHMDFVDLDRQEEVRVTFEAENNLDFRLGTGPLRYTGLVRSGDIAAISRVGESRYQLRLYSKSDTLADELSRHAVNFVGHQQKRYGFVSNEEFQKLLGHRFQCPPL